MKRLSTYGLGPYYSTRHEFNQIRRVYEHHGATVYVDREFNPVWTEVFAFYPDGPLWFVADYSGRNWAHAVQKAERLVDEWMEWLNA